MYDSVRDFARDLARRGELLRVDAPASPVLEIAAAADLESKRPAPNPPSRSARVSDPRFAGLGGRALLFSNVEGCEFPVLINAWGSYRRMEMALGCEDGGFAAIAARIAELVKPEPPRSLGDAFRKARQFLPLLRTPPRRLRGRGPCQEVEVSGDAIDLTRLPMLRCWPDDGDFAALGYPPGLNDGVPGLGTGPEWERLHRGRYITLGQVHTIHADDADHPRPSSHNIGMYRVQLMGRDRLAMHWHMHHDGARHWRSWKARGKPMPVAVTLGGESVMPYAATAPLPPGISELLLAGFLHGRGIPMVRARTVPLWVPANAEIVIEGYVAHEAGGIGWDPREPGAGPLGAGAVFEGPFGDHTGFYSMPDRYPVFTVTAVTHRRDAVFPATVVGLPPQEDYFLGKATERIFLPLLKTLIHDIEDYDLPIFGAFHNAAMIRIRKDYPGQARRVMHSVWGAGQMAWTKAVFVVDESVDVHDHHAVLRAASERCVPVRDLETVTGPLDILDHAAPFIGLGTKIGFDCTRRLPGEELRPHPGHHAVGAPPVGPDDDAGAGRLAGALAAIPGVDRVACPPSLGGGWIFVRVTPGAIGSAVADQAAAAAESSGVCARVIVLGPDACVDNPDDALFHWLAHADAGRDLRAVASGSARAEVYDSTPKPAGGSRLGLPVRAWPPILRTTDRARERAVELIGR
ncbi:MAG: UbiD family decarboxylase [Phycisphaeraceae bacterium]|nr:MAG: UbiD family decarboxylase [Phycisphaeraceae bacterium]